jgi:hypothetical protein
MRCFLTYQSSLPGVAPHVGSGTITRQVYPVIDGKFETKREGDYQGGFRKEFTGDLTFYNSEADSLREFDIFCDYFQPCSKFFITIYPENTCFVDERWDGWFTIYHGKFDKDRKTFIVTPKPNDEYLKVDQIWEKEVDVYELVDKHTIVAQAYAQTESIELDLTDDWDYEMTYAYHEIGCDTIPVPYMYVGFSNDVINHIRNTFPSQFPPMFFAGGTAHATDDFWFIDWMRVCYERSANFDLGYLKIDKYQVRLFRTITYTADDDNGNVSPGDYWVFEEALLLPGDIPGAKWVRKMPYNTTEWTELDYSFSYDCSTNVAGEGWTYQYQLVRPLSESIQYTRVRLLTDVFNALINPYGLNFKSQFLESYPNIVSGDYIRLDGLYLGRISDVRRPESTNEAKNWKIKLKDLTEDICKIFNCRWEVVGTEFKIEGKKYFENGRTYSSYSYISKDLTGSDRLLMTNKWAYREDEFCDAETFEYLDANNLDFSKATIDYSTLCLSSETKDYKTVLLTADLPMYQTDTGTAEQGFVLMLTIDIDYIVGLNLYPIVQSYASQLTNELIPNGYLGWYNLLNKYHGYGRVLPDYTINNQTPLVENASYMRMRVQEVTFPLANGVLNMYGKIRTELGDGEIAEMAWDIKTGLATVKLYYYE